MSNYARTYYIKIESIPEFLWTELTGVTSLSQAKQLAEHIDNNLGEIGMLHLPFGVEVISKKNTKGEWEDVCSPD